MSDDDAPQLSDLVQIWLDENFPEDGFRFKFGDVLYDKEGRWFGAAFNGLAQFRFLDSDDARTIIVLEAADPDFFEKMRERIDETRRAKVKVVVLTPCTE